MQKLQKKGKIKLLVGVTKMIRSQNKNLKRKRLVFVGFVSTPGCNSNNPKYQIDTLLFKAE